MKEFRVEECNNNEKLDGTNKINLLKRLHFLKLFQQGLFFVKLGWPVFTCL
jgi:hypothetical protein